MSSRTPLVLTLAAAIVFTAPLAIAATGDNLREGVRNPAGGGASGKETKIIAKTGRDAYGTRQSNLGAGGGAIYGCRSGLDASSAATLGDPAKSTPCVRVNNLSSGKAFDFQSNTGRLIGVMQAGQHLTTPRPDVAPLITNATGVAVGLNADRVDGLNASDIVAQAAAAAGGKGGSTACPADTTLTGGGCIENAPRAAANYADAAAACGQAGRRLVPPDVLLHARTLDPINLGSGEMSNDISGITVGALALNGVVTQGYVTVSDGGTMSSNALTESAPYRCITA
jgi:hypothetical protein